MEKNVLKKLGNTKQLVSAYDLTINDGAARGKRLILVNNNRLEVCFNADNALDIAWVKYCGINVSFLSKNGINSNEGVFGERFDGGFLYTCGLDNLSSIEKDVAIHGSLHLRKAQNVSYTVNDDSVKVCGEILTTRLVGKNLILKREYTITDKDILISDTVINKGYTDVEYVLLYHINYGYPFLDAGLKLEFDNLETLAANATPKENVPFAKTITESQGVGPEDLFYHYLKEGKVNLINDNLKIKCQMNYDINKLPILVEWKNLYDGDYVLGIEPSTTRFDEYKKRLLKPDEENSFEVTISFDNI